MKKGRPITTDDRFLEAQQFIAAVMRERFDYTKWQQAHFDTAEAHALNEAAAAYEMELPFTLNRQATA